MEDKLNPVSARLGTRRQPEASRQSILRAALAEFGDHGLSGARMDTIAEAAGVNKALLYYYFRDKDALYGEVLDDFFVRMHGRIMEVFDTPSSAGERLLRYARAHFDSIAASPYYARLFQREMMSAGPLGSPHFSRIVERFIKPISLRVMEVLAEGVQTSEFRAVNVEQFAPSLVATIVYYFVIAPVVRKLRNTDPFSPEAIQARRAAVLDFIAAGLFADREAGLRLAEEIAAKCASPEIAQTSKPRPPHRVASRRRK